MEKTVLFIINDGPYGNERPYNAMRLALNLVKRSEVKVRVFLSGDAVQNGGKQRAEPRQQV